MHPLTIRIHMQNIPINRRDLLTAGLGSTIVKRVEIKEIVFAPGQKAAFHKHPCPVVGHIISGMVLFQVEGQSSKILRPGDAFFEPFDTPIVHFDNASYTEPMTFIAYYLLNEGTELIEMLPEKKFPGTMPISALH